MNRRIYRKSVAPHNQRVATDIGIPTDRVDKFIELMNFYEARKDTIKLLYNPHLTGNKVRTSGNLKFVSKGYSANSVNQELGANLMVNTYDWFDSNGDGLADGFTSSTNAIKSIVSGNGFIGNAQRITATDNSLTVLNLSNNINISVGKTYKISLKYRSNININVSLPNVAVIKTIPQNNSDAIYYTFTYLINSINTGRSYFNLSFTGNSGNFFEVDEWIVQEVLSNDLTQTTSTSQPYLSGNIAPTETLGIKNPNGGSNYLTHPTISFGDNEAWSVTTVLNWNGNPSVSTDVLYGGVGTYGLKLKSSNSNLVSFVSANSVGTDINYNSSKLIGKLNIITLVASNGILKFYINGILFFTSNYLLNSTTADFSYLLMGRDGTAFSTTSIIKSHVITSHAPTAQEVAQEYALLRSIYPDIESVRIGEQEWATSNCEMAATPQGNVIQEMQANANVEKITNVADREFTSDTGFWQKQTGGVTISGGTANIGEINAYANGIQRVDALTIGKWYKITVSIVNYISGSPFINDTGGAGFALPKANGTYTVYFKPIYYPNIRLTSGTNSNSFSYDNISIQEIGWSGSQELYDGIYAQTAGTVEQKTYAAVKAAAMWCHYNNSVDNGAIYGKLYNWFAVKLLQMDIDKYNTDNPTALWGWRVPTQADFQTLSTYLGGDAVSGGKLKKEGTTYWNSPNTGADNSSGFSALSAGFIYEDGVMQSGYTSFATLTVASQTQFTIRQLYYNAPTFNQFYQLNTRGVSLRLIKST